MTATHPADLARDLDRIAQERARILAALRALGYDVQTPGDVERVAGQVAEWWTERCKCGASIVAGDEVCDGCLPF